jgi:hypothetical protein
MFIYDLSFTLLVAAVAIAGIGARAAWQAIRGAAVLDRAVTRVTTGLGMTRLPVSSDADELSAETPVARLQQLEAPR